MISEGRDSVSTGIRSGNTVLSSLSINNARVEHGGRYECKATNTHGSATHTARLNVYGKIF